MNIQGGLVSGMDLERGNAVAFGNGPHGALGILPNE